MLMSLALVPQITILWMIDIEVPPDGENIHHVSHSSTPMQSPTSALSSLLSVIGYATKPLDILPNITMCNFHTLIASHLSYGVLVNSDADGWRQVITSFYIKCYVSSVSNKVYLSDSNILNFISC